MDRGSAGDRDRLRDLEVRVAALERRLDADDASVDDAPDDGPHDGMDDETADGTAEGTPPRQLPDAVEGTTAAVPAPGDAAPPAEGY